LLNHLCGRRVLSDDTDAGARPAGSALPDFSFSGYIYSDSALALNGRELVRSWRSTKAATCTAATWASSIISSSVQKAANLRRRCRWWLHSCLVSSGRESDLQLWAELYHNCDNQSVSIPGPLRTIKAIIGSYLVWLRYLNDLASGCMPRHPVLSLASHVRREGVLGARCTLIALLRTDRRSPLHRDPRPPIAETYPAIAGATSALGSNVDLQYHAGGCAVDVFLIVSAPSNDATLIDWTYRGIGATGTRRHNWRPVR
jgi:hypothetical protein